MLSPTANQEMIKCISITQSLLERSVEAIKTGKNDIAGDIFKDKDKMRRSERKCNKAHLKRVKLGECNASMTPHFSDILYNLSRIADNCISIAEEAADSVCFVELGKNAKKLGFAEGVGK